MFLDAGGRGGGGRGAGGGDPSFPAPNSTRLQVFREAFDRFMDEFKTYTPVLKRIKSEYERLLSNQGSRLRHIPVLKARLATIMDETSNRIAQLQVRYVLCMYCIPWYW